MPALRGKYLGYMREIAEKDLDWNRMSPLAQRFQALIAAEVASDTRKLYSTQQFQNGLAGAEPGLKTFMDRRRAYLLRRLSEL